MEDLQVTYLPTDALIPYTNNAKIHGDADVDAIMASIKECGFNDPIGIWKGIIVEGHGRLIAAKRLGLETVPTIRLDHMTDEQRKVYALAHNKTAELSGWDFDVLAAELKDLADVDMTAFGFDADTVDEGTRIIEDDYEPEFPEEPRAKRGEIWQLDAHRIMCGDATSPEDINNLMGGGKADLYLTDPPYNIDYTGKTKKKLKIENDKLTDYRGFLAQAFSAAQSNIKPGAAFYIWHADTEAYNVRGACTDVGWQVRECLIWHKDTFTLGRQDYQWQHEPCLYGWNSGDSHTWYSDRKQTTVLNFDRPKRSEEHPTMKPVPLIGYLINNSSKRGDIVFDTFLGSGTTLIACEQSGRCCYGMELDPRYVDVAIARWESFTGHKAMLL